MIRALALLLLFALPAAAQGTIEFQPEPMEPAVEGPAAPPEAPPSAIPLEFLPEPLPVSLNAPAAPGPHAPAPIRLTQLPDPVAQPAAAELAIPGLPPEPPAAPPPPPEFSPRPAPAPSRARPPQIPLPDGPEALPNGGLRIRGTALDDATRVALADYGRRLAALERGRVTVFAEVSGPAEDAHLARRLSLARAQAAKAALMEGGLDATRIDLRPLGRTAAGMDRLDVLPPGVDRSDSPR
ncbi:hypothetical protein [Plastoroseomonas arctica]|uniref:OmpA-like domain-containing protein n=1 Tax=Plastoroseomonas arctica TaxID=1509237 RepID=A0AAF1K3X1_9PROT|nr:hypothetical protein [Plastoroseomonas arctica]MBR0656253.1 hypothetical protein [Plastoroseomonas arctica]